MTQNTIQLHNSLFYFRGGGAPLLSLELGGAPILSLKLGGAPKFVTAKS